ncbi:acetyltransferase (GNAT) family protein [Glaciihabitans tibetensis]|uniref:Acetyltransferase (GNAT) family protein n=1 Tax=Glaciihabitans tibetensis TaxID=1266600 RepID=A0A2T0VHD6_9MICO|nr:acetyltransferase (GNAT) family protein [Glaciihabitans tibetensis]
MRSRALKNEKTGASRTFVSVDSDSGLVAGYYCLSASSLARDDATSNLRRNMPDPIPVILIGRLAVDKRFAGLGLGVSLLQEAIRKGVEASRIVGARALVVHAISESAERFYFKFGFTPVPESARVMFMTMADAEATIADMTL